MLMRDVVRETPGRAWELALLEKRKGTLQVESSPRVSGPKGIEQQL